jgi:hypothetical protein
VVGNGYDLQDDDGTFASGMIVVEVEDGPGDVEMHCDETEGPASQDNELTFFVE